MEPSLIPRSLQDKGLYKDLATGSSITLQQAIDKDLLRGDLSENTKETKMFHIRQVRDTMKDKMVNFSDAVRDGLLLKVGPQTIVPVLL